MRKILAPALALLASLVIVPAAGAALLYAPVYSDDAVHALDIQTNGSVAPIAGSPFPVPDGGTISFVTSTDGRKGVAGYLVGGTFRGFSIADNGAIAPAQDKISFTNIDAYSGAITPDSRFAYFGTRYYPPSGPAGVRGFSLADNGALTEVSGSPYQTANDYLDVAVSPDGRFLFASGPNLVASFAIGADGALTHLGDTPVGAARYLMTSPDGRFLIATSFGTTYPALVSFAIGGNGSLTALGDPVELTGASAQTPGISPDGRFVYWPENNADLLHTIRINPDGTLGAVGAAPQIDLGSVVVSPDSKQLYGYFRDTNILARAEIAVDGQPGVFAKVADYDPGEPVRMHFKTDFGTIADFTSAPAAKTLTMRFNGSKTVAKRGSVGSHTWAFGDNTAGSGAIVEHTFKKPGVYDVNLTAGDSSGCTTAVTYIGQSAPCAGSAQSSKTVKIDTPAWVTSLALKPKKVGKKGTIRYKLTEKARVTFTVEKPSKGRMVGATCRKQTRKNKKGKRCTYWQRVSKSFRANGKAGRKANSVRFSGKIGKTKLKKGSYRLKAVATDSSKAKGPAKYVKFRVR